MRTSLDKFDPRKGFDRGLPSSVDALSEALRRIACQETKRLKDKETSGVSEMGKRSREIVAKFSCENFAQQAMRAAEAASA